MDIESARDFLFHLLKYFSKLITGHFFPPVSYILPPSPSFSFVLPVWFFVCSLSLHNVCYQHPLLFQNLKPPIILCFHGLSYRSRILSQKALCSINIVECLVIQFSDVSWKYTKGKFNIFFLMNYQEYIIKSHCDINTCINLSFFSQSDLFVFIVFLCITTFFCVHFCCWFFFPSHYISCFIYFSTNFNTL